MKRLILTAALIFILGMFFGTLFWSMNAIAYS